MVLVSFADSQSDGWKMTDRFYGFRYQISGSKVHEVGYRKSIQEKADLYNCFGWAQNQVDSLNASIQKVVGEVRCNKKSGPMVEEFIKKEFPAGAVVTDVQTKVYEDTKIKLHFSHFKILVDDRETCFRDEPHQCLDFKLQDKNAVGVSPPENNKIDKEINSKDEF